MRKTRGLAFFVISGCCLLIMVSLATIFGSLFYKGVIRNPLYTSFDWPLGLSLDSSPVHGHGVFTTRHFPSNQPLAITLATWYGLPFIPPTIWGHLNHCDSPVATARLEKVSELCCGWRPSPQSYYLCGTCVHVEEVVGVAHVEKISGSAWMLVTTRELEEGEEITVDFSTNPWFAAEETVGFRRCLSQEEKREVEREQRERKEKKRKEIEEREAQREREKNGQEEAKS